MFIHQQTNEEIDRSLRLAEHDVISGADMTLPVKATRAGKILGFNETTGNPEASILTADAQTLANIASDIATLADIEDGTDATDAIQTVAGISSNVSTVSGISSNVTTVAGISSDVTAVAGDATDIGTVATNIASVNTVATNIADVITVANDLNEAVSELETVANDLNEATSEIDTVANSIGNVDIVGANIANVNTVAGNNANVTTVAGISANVTTVAGISGNVSTVAGISSDVTTVAADGTDIGTVATNITNVNTVAGISGNVTTVAGISANVTSVAGNATNINTVAGDSTAINAVASDATDIGTVATNIANVNTVAGISANVTTVAGDTANIGTIATNLNGTDTIGTVAGSISNVNSVGGSIANVNTVATNLASVNSFADTYRIGATDPTTSLDTGDLFYNTTSSALKVYTGSAWEQGVTAGSGFLPLTGGGLTGNLTFGDNDKAIFGAGSDLQIYHDSANSYIEDVATGSLIIRGTDLHLQDREGNDYIGMDDTGTGGTVRLKHNASTKLTTTSTGIDVSGEVTTTNDIKFTTDRHKFVGGTGANLELGTYSSNNTSRDVHLEIDSAGRVGIGTSSPSNPFEVIGSVDSNIATFSTLGDGGGASNRGLSIAADTYGGSIRTVGSSVSMGFDVNGSERMRITSGGNVSVGGTNATARLNAIAANWPENALGVYSANIAGQTNFAGIAFFNQDTDSATGNVADIYTNPTGTLSLTSASNPAIQLKYGSSGISGGTAALTVDGSGNVGIGTSSPVAKLDVNSGDIAISSTQTSDNGDLGELQFWNTTNAGSGSGTSFVNDVASIQGQMEGTGNNSGGSLHFYTKTDGGSKTQQMTITGDGNVGIGSSIPGDKLEVDGIINIKRLNQLSVLSTTATGVANFEFGFNKSGSTTRGMPNDTAFINMRQGYPIIIATQETERMRIHSGGQLSLATSDATHGFNVGQSGTDFRGRFQGNNQYRLALQNGTSNLVWLGSGGADNFRVSNSSGSTLMELTSSGQVVAASFSGNGSALTNISGTVTNTGGSPAYYGARAFANMVGDGAVSIRNSQNVSSITDEGTGKYRVNFSTAMPDANFTCVSQGSWTNANTNDHHPFVVAVRGRQEDSHNPSWVRMSSGTPYQPGLHSGVQYDADTVEVAIFR